MIERIPKVFHKLQKLRTLDLSNNYLSVESQVYLEIVDRKTDIDIVFNNNIERRDKLTDEFKKMVELYYEPFSRFINEDLKNMRDNKK